LSAERNSRAARSALALSESESAYLVRISAPALSTALSRPTLLTNRGGDFRLVCDPAAACAFLGSSPIFKTHSGGFWIALGSGIRLRLREILRCAVNASIAALEDSTDLAQAVARFEQALQLLTIDFLPRPSARMFGFAFHSCSVPPPIDYLESGLNDFSAYRNFS